MSYRAVLRTPGVRRIFTAAMIGRLSYGTAPLALMLSVADGRAYARAGLVMAVFGAASVVLTPLRGGLVDRFGARRVLPPMAAGYALVLTAFAAATRSSATPVAVLFALAVAAGASAPPLGPVTRAQWSRLLPAEHLRRRAFGLDTVCEELLYVGGPLLSGLIAGTGRPQGGLLLSAALVLGGTLALAGALRDGATGPVHRPERPRGGGGFALLAKVRQPLAVAAGTGAGLGAFGLLVIVFAARHGNAAGAAWVEAALAASSAVGGLVLGAVDWRAPAPTRLAVLTLVLAGALALAATAPDVPLLAACAALAGLSVAPTLTTAYLVTDELAAPDRRTQAGAWVNAAFNAGGSLGTAGTGLLTGWLPLGWCFVLAAVPVALAVTAVRSARPAAWSPAPTPGPRTDEPSAPALL